MKFLQGEIFHLVNALDLPHQEFGVAYDFDRLWSGLECVLEGGNQTLVFREVIGLMAEVLAERRHRVPRLVLDHDPIPRGAGIAASPAIAIGDEVIRGRIFAGRAE